ncbi:hypothetical protein HMSSN139_34280 [Paenibacillus sp. HMSSN-139]|nr:hypothetical protein HMSSN139_34280 [Paenibacillus sp. HMSSN-139]
MPRFTIPSQEFEASFTNKLYEIPAPGGPGSVNEPTRERVKGNEFLLRSQHAGNKGDFKALSYAGT